jgi:type 1 fimbria pilin
MLKKPVPCKVFSYIKILPDGQRYGGIERVVGSLFPIAIAWLHPFLFCRYVTMKKLLLASCLAVASIPLIAQAASVDLNVTGRVIPTSCIPAFAGGSDVNLGRIFSSTLAPDRQNDLPQRDISLQITCSAPASVEIAVTDNRGASKVPGLTFNGRSGDELYYGLGSTQGVGIGGFGLLSGLPRTDGVPQILLARTLANPSWSVPTNGLITNAPTTYSWGASLASGPAPARLHTLPMKVAAAIRATSELPPTTDEFDLDGSVTFDVFYL